MQLTAKDRGVVALRTAQWVNRQRRLVEALCVGGDSTPNMAPASLEVRVMRLVEARVDTQHDKPSQGSLGTLTRLNVTGQILYPGVA